MSQEYEHEKWFRGDDDAEISDIQKDGNHTTIMLPDLIEGVEHQHGYSPYNNGNTMENMKHDKGKKSGGRRSDYDLDEDEVDERYRMNYGSIEKRFSKKAYKVDVTSPEFKDRTEREVEVEGRTGVIFTDQGEYDDNNNSNNNDNYDNERSSYRQRFIEKMQSGINHRPGTTGSGIGTGRHANYTKAHGHKVVQRELSEEDDERQGGHVSRDNKEAKDADVEKRGWRPRIRKDKTGFGPKAPTFEGSYTRAMAKLQEDRVKRKEKRDKKKEEDKQRAKDEIFHITGQFGKIRNAYKDLRTDEEVSRRQKQMAFHGNGAKKRPASAGVLMPASFAFRAQLPNTNVYVNNSHNTSNISNDNNGNENENNQSTLTEQPQPRNKKSFSELAYTSLPFTPAPFLPIPNDNIVTTTNTGKRNKSSGKNNSKSGSYSSNNSMKGASSNVMVIDDTLQYDRDRDNDRMSDRDNEVAASIDSGIYPFSPGLAAMTIA